MIAAVGVLLATSAAWGGHGVAAAADPGDDRGLASGRLPVGPRGGNFWTDVPPNVPAGAKPGDIHWVQPREDAPKGSRGWNVIYVSEVMPGRLMYVSGEVYIPRSPSRALRSVVMWNHETAGNADACAPSRSNLTSAQGLPRVPAITEVLRAGHVVVTSDYPGLGLAGPAYYMAGAPNARASLDLVRVAKQFPGLDIDGRVAMYGWSQGGQTTLWAAQIAAAYAPEITLVGASLIAPASDIRDLTLNSMQDPELAGYVISTLPGIKAANPELRYEDFLTPAGLAQFPAMADGCFDVWGAAAGVQDPYQPGAMSPDGPWWTAMTNAQNYDFATLREVPLITFQGADDTTVPASLSERDRRLMCDARVRVDYREVPGADHVSIVGVAADALPAWFQQRFEGRPSESNCP